ncbi:MAG TPA: M28 family peptidase [Acidobacteriaceae bacterium]
MPRRLSTTAVLLLLALPVLCGHWALLAQTVAKSTAPRAPAGEAPTAVRADTVNPRAADIHGVAANTTTQSRTLFFYTSPRSTVEMAVHTIPATDEERLARLRDDFAQADCGGNNMREQPVADKHGARGENLVCNWPGDAAGTIVVVAHYEHEGKGEGAIDDWSGAALLPFLYQAVQGQPRRNSYVFLESWKGEGADTWLKSQTKEERKRIRAVIDLDGLGCSYTRFFTTFSPFESVPLGATHLQTELLWAALSDGLTQAPEQLSPHHWLSVDPTGPFRAIMVPSIVIHSVPADDARIPGSAADIAAAVDGNAYFTTYHLMCAFLTSLDRVAAKLDTNDHMWDTAGAVDVEPEQETPVVTFRQFNNGRLGATKSH